jgi:hypothetical protein
MSGSIVSETQVVAGVRRAGAIARPSPLVLSILSCPRLPG